MFSPVDEVWEVEIVDIVTSDNVGIRLSDKSCPSKKFKDCF